jgi:arylsulfatase
MGDTKLIATGLTGPWELYDLGKDRSEQHDLAAAQSDKAKKMAALWKQRDDEFTSVREAAPPSTRVRMPRGKG